MNRRILQSALACVGVAGVLAIPAGASAATKTGSAILATNVPASATAKCPSGQRATGGGLLTAPPVAGNIVRPFESRKIGQRSWRVSAVNFTTSSQVLTTYVYCSQDASSTKEKSATVASNGAGATGSFVNADATCTGGRKAQAGGWVIPTGQIAPPTPIGHVLESFRFSSKVWRIKGLQQFNDSVPVTSYVYCSKDSAPKARSTSGTATANSQLFSVQSNKCKRGTKVLAGGFSQPGAIPAPTSRFLFNLHGSLKVGNRWQVSMQSNVAPATLTSTAYCG